MAILTGVFAGFVASRSFAKQPMVLFDDRDNFGAKVVKYPKINHNYADFVEDRSSCCGDKVRPQTH
jgi:hypothetical protein